MTQFYTYLHCKPGGDPFYVGKGTLQRSNSFSKRSVHHRNIVAKYGKEQIQILRFPRNTELDAFNDEIQWIRVLREYGCILCNQTDGGEGASGYKPPPRTPEWCANHSAKMKGKPGGHTGKKHSIDTLAKMSKPKTAEHKAKISVANKGKNRPPHSVEHCAKLSAAKKTWWIARKNAY